MSVESAHTALVDDLIRLRGVVMLIGARDTGKTSFARDLATEAVRVGKVVGYVDADTAQTTVGPPTCIGLKLLETPSDFDRVSTADDLRFVGGITPEGLVLQHVVGTAALVDVARPLADLVIVDTTGSVSGVIGQTLKYHKMELLAPDTVVALQRGAEIEPLVGMLRRFFTARVEMTGVHPEVVPESPDERSARRAKAFAAAFAEPLQRWRVRPTVFAPTLPAALDFARLDRMVVGLQDDRGRCRGLGALEATEDTLRVVTNRGDEMRGLRLGSLRIDLDTFRTMPVRLREVMFGLDGAL
ncbi:MAG: Clp1/GlmU family protein [Acidimicrobiia bacterium]